MKKLLIIPIIAAALSTGSAMAACNTCGQPMKGPQPIPVQTMHMHKHPAVVQRPAMGARLVRVQPRPQAVYVNNCGCNNGCGNANAGKLGVAVAGGILAGGLIYALVK